MNPTFSGVLASLTVLALAFVAGGVVAQDTNETQAGNETEQSPPGGVAEPGERGAPKGFVETDGRFEGEHVSFAYDASRGILCDWSIDGEPAIEAVLVSGLRAEAEPRGSLVVIGSMGAGSSGAAPGGPGSGQGQGQGGSAGGDGAGTDADNGTADNGTAGNGTAGGEPCAAHEASAGAGTDPNADPSASNGTGNDTGIHLHDTPNGFVKAKLGAPQTVEWRFSSNVSISAAGSARLNVQGPSFQAVLWAGPEEGDPAFSVSGNIVTFQGDAGDQLFWRVAPSATPEDRPLHDAVAQGAVGAEVMLLSKTDHLVAEFDNVTVTQVTIEKTQIEVSLDIDIEAPEPAPGSGAPPSDQPDGNGTSGNTSQGNGTSGDPSQGNGTSGGGAGGNGTNASAPPVTIVVLDLDVTQVTDVTDIRIELDGVEVSLATDLDDALRLDEQQAEAFIAGEENGTVRVIASVASGSHSFVVASASGAEIVDEQFVTDAGPGDGLDDGLGGDLPPGAEPFPPPETGPSPGPDDRIEEREQETPAPGLFLIVCALGLLAFVGTRARR